MKQSDPGNFWSIIPAGGSGTRLWPLSRPERPKFLLRLAGEQTLIQQTFDRLCLISRPDHIVVICGPDHREEILVQLPELPAENIVCEPSQKGTGPAIGLASLLIQHRDPDAVIGSFAADHVVTDTEAFVDSVAIGKRAAANNMLVTIGIEPTRPETGYGYIERTDQTLVSAESGHAYAATRFIEKPDLPRAEKLVADGHHLWNASMFIWKASAFADSLQRFQHATYSALIDLTPTFGTVDFESRLEQAWAPLPTFSIDQGVMEHLEQFAVVPASMGWSDVGDWQNVALLSDPDASGNRFLGDVVATESTDSLAWSLADRTIALVGVRNLGVIDTGDAVLVVDLSDTQRVKQIVEQIRNDRNVDHDAGN